MMKTVYAKVALAALCATALTAVSHTAYAGTVDITGGTYLSSSPNPLYGTAPSQNNVVNATGVAPSGSVLFDPTGNINYSTTPWIQNGQVSANTSGAYAVNWFFTGSESGFNITFNAGAVSFTEGNQNNNCVGCSAPVGPPLTSGSFQILGQTNYGAGDPLAFSLSWTGGSVNNSTAQSSPGIGQPNLLFSYLDPSTFGSTGFADLTRTAGDWFVFALNDSGGTDDNHDDFVGFAQVVSCGETGCAPPQFTPLPAALPLFGSVIGGGFLAGAWRRRRKHQTVKA